MSNLTLKVKPAATLNGATIVPGDKSISHRSLLLGALAEGTNTVRGWLPAGDTLATLSAVQSLGIKVIRQGNTLTFEGKPYAAPDAPIDCKNAGTLMRLIAGLLAWQDFESVLDGTPQLRKRPMKRITEPLTAMGADITSTDGYAPLTIRPAQLKGMEHRPKIASAQVKSAILLGGLGADAETVVYEAGPSRDHTERMLLSMGADISVKDMVVRLAPLSKPLKPLDMTVPGDISSAAFPLIAAAIVTGSDVMVNAVGLNPTRTGLIDVLKAMGADLTVLKQVTQGGEPVGDIKIKGGGLRGTAISGGLVVRAIDEFPIIAVAATQAQGTTIITDAAELRVKEVDRISMLAQELNKMGAEIEEQPDGMIINGPVKLTGAEVDSHGDHRLGMALAIAGLVAEGETHVLDAGSIADSFPGFADVMNSIGAQMEEVEVS